MLSFIHWLIVFQRILLKMSYAKAAGPGSSQPPRYFNEKMVVCMSTGTTYEQLAEVFDHCGIWKTVTGFQKVHFNRRFALVIEDTNYRDLLVERGLNINGIHVRFACHKRRDTKLKVYLSQIQFGITPKEIKDALEYYGDISEVNPVTKVIQSRRVDTGDRILMFKRLARRIPSYVFIRGWRAFIKYTGQPLICGVCGLTTHFAKD